MNLQEFKDTIAEAAFGMTRDEAHKEGICIVCKKPPILVTEADKREYKISAICGKCWPEVVGPES